MNLKLKTVQNKLITLLVLLLGFQSCQIAQNSELFTIYLVRHSEKELASENESDPPLTKCGMQRSESLSIFLNDVNLEAIYSTDYNRTINTALPTANAKELQIKNKCIWSENFARNLPAMSFPQLLLLKVCYILLICWLIQLIFPADY